MGHVPLTATNPLTSTCMHVHTLSEYMYPSFPAPPHLYDHPRIGPGQGDWKGYPKQLGLGL